MAAWQWGNRSSVYQSMKLLDQIIRCVAIDFPYTARFFFSFFFFAFCSFNVSRERKKSVKSSSNFHSPHVFSKRSNQLLSKWKCEQQINHEQCKYKIIFVPCLFACRPFAIAWCYIPLYLNEACRWKSVRKMMCMRENPDSVFWTNINITSMHIGIDKNGSRSIFS